MFGEVGGIYLNFGLWAVAIYPAWLVLRHFGTSKTHSEEAQDPKTAEVAGLRDTSSGEEVHQLSFPSKEA